MNPSIPRPLVRANQWVIVISVLLAWVTHLVWILALPFLAGLLGLVFNWNPVMFIARYFLRHAPTEYPQEDREQQRFNQWICVLCLGLSLVAFARGMSGLGYIFSGMVAVAAFVAVLGFCVGCFLRFQLQQLRYRRSLR